MRFSDDFLTELRARADIEDIIGKYTEIRHRGSRTPVCLCPFHAEKTPSFVVYRDTQSYYCFGCGAGGDVITFVKNIERLDYTEAVRFLCERTGMNMPTDPVDNEYARLRRRCYEANREAARFFHSCLLSEKGKTAREYLEKRQLSQETVTHFGLGFAPDSWDSLIKHLKSKGFSDVELLSFDLAKKTQKGNTIDAFRNRLMFPIIDLRGNVIAFGGRVLDDSKPKYLNTSDTVVYKKSQGLYALNFAKNSSKRQLILCEGYMDVIAMHQAGFTTAVAGLGTAFTNEQISLLSRYCDELVLAFDSDEAGVKATQRALRMLSNSTMKLRVLHLAGGKDPDEIIKTYGVERMRSIIEGAVNDTEFALLQAKKKYDISVEDGKLGYLNEAVMLLADINNAIEKDLYISRLAQELNVARESILAQVGKASKNKAKIKQRQEFDKILKDVTGDDSGKIPNPQRRQFLKAAKAEEMLLALLLKNPDYFKKLSGKLSADVFVTDYNKRIFEGFEQRITDGRSLDLSVFGEDNENEEMGYLAYLLALSGNVANTVEQCEECIKVLLQEKNRKKIPEIGQMSDDEFRAMFEQIRKNTNKKDVQ